MDKILELFEQSIKNATNAFPSIYTKEDVVQLLINLKNATLTDVAELLTENATVSAVNEDEFQEFSSQVCNTLKNYINNSDEIVDYGSAEFSIEYNNQLTLEHISLDVDTIEDTLQDILLDQFQESFGKLLTNTEE
jgi:hypothetical protein